MIEPILILIAIPLNLIGFILKHKTKLSNKLIPVVISALSFLVCFIIGQTLGMAIFHSVVLFALVNGIVVASVATHNQDFTHGIKTTINNIVARAYELINLDKEVKMDRLKKWRKTLLSNFLAVLFVAILTFIVGWTNLKMGNASWIAVIDTTILAFVLSSTGILILDLIKKIVMKDDGLNLQYILAFCLASLSVGGFLVAYVAPTWEITITAGVIFILGLAGSLFTVRYGYIPSLRTKEEVIQDVIRKAWIEYKELSDAEVEAKMKADVKYSFKCMQWGSDLDVAKPLFQDSENNAISTNDAIKLNRAVDKSMIQKVINDFKTIIGTRPKEVK